MSTTEMTISEFEAADAADPAALIGYLEVANALPGLRAAKAALLEELRLRPGQRVLDAGCGYGQDTADLAAGVAPGGRAGPGDPARGPGRAAGVRPGHGVPRPPRRGHHPAGPGRPHRRRRPGLDRPPAPAAAGRGRAGPGEPPPAGRPGRLAFFRQLLAGPAAGLAASGALPAERLDRWWAALAEAEAAGCFTGGGTAFVAAATKPSPVTEMHPRSHR